MVKKEVEKLLKKVQKPARYTGGELNSVVKDKKTKEPFSYEDGIGKKIYIEGLKLGAILRPMWNCIYFITPYIITEKEIEKLTDIAFEALNRVLPNEGIQ